MNRERKIIRASWWAVTLNAALAAMKLTVGFISGSYAVIADGIDSATDIVSSLVVLLAARIINKPPNIRFAYGYQKADTVAAKILSFVIFFAGAQLAWSTVQMLLQEVERETPSLLAIWVTVISIGGKLVLTSFLHRTGKKVESPMLMANARNMRNDIFISLSVLVSLVATVREFACRDHDRCFCDKGLCVIKFDNCWVNDLFNFFFYLRCFILFVKELT